MNAFGIAAENMRMQASTIDRIVMDGMRRLDAFYDAGERQCKHPGCLSYEVTGSGYCQLHRDRLVHKHDRRGG